MEGDGTGVRHRRGGSEATSQDRRLPRRGDPRTERDLRRRTLSQNFLRDPGADQFLGAFTLDPDQLCVEVGAGEGVLTQRLVEICPRLVAYEIDEHVARVLTDRLGEREGVRIVVGDFLAARPPAEPFQVVGNVPFSVTSAIVEWCLAARQMTTTTITTQLEYAKKRTGAYGRWSLRTVLTWPWFSWTLLGKIDRTAFRPVPRVDVGVLQIARRPQPLVTGGQAAAYRRMVEVGFSGVGGTLYRSLMREYPASSVTAAFRAVGVDRDLVVAFVEPRHWLDLFAELESSLAQVGGLRRGSGDNGPRAGQRAGRSHR